MQLKKEATAVDKADPHAAAIARAVAHLRTQATAKDPDGAVLRALVIAGAKGYDIGTALEGPLGFLKTPAQWPAADRIALGHALAAAERHGRAASTDLKAAAKVLAADQQQDGSFGSLLHTWQARATLIESGMQPDEVWIILIDRWVRGLSALDSIADAAAALLALDLASDVMADNLRRAALQLIRPGQTAEGGWGPQAAARPQVFDTALTVLALSLLDTEPRLARSTYRPEELKEAIAKGKAYLVSQQRPDGSWSETDQKGEAQKVSPAAWALLALLQ